MKLGSKDNQLIAEAYELKLLKEGILSSGIKATLQPLFNSLFKKIKEKQPEAFSKLAAAKTPQELLDMIKSQSSASASQQSEGIQDVVEKIREAVGTLINKLEVAGTAGLIFAGLGSIISLLEQASSGTPNFGMMIAGLMLVAIKFATDAGFDIAAKLNK